LDLTRDLTEQCQDCHLPSPSAARPFITASSTWLQTLLDYPLFCKCPSTQSAATQAATSISKLIQKHYTAPTAIRERRRTLRYRNLLVRQVVQLKNKIAVLL
jgi:hypothetical protein